MLRGINLFLYNSRNVSYSQHHSSSLATLGALVGWRGDQVVKELNLVGRESPTYRYLQLKPRGAATPRQSTGEKSHKAGASYTWTVSRPAPARPGPAQQREVPSALPVPGIGPVGFQAGRLHLLVGRTSTL